MQDNRRKDSFIEAEVCKFMDKYVYGDTYPNGNPNTQGMITERCTDTIMQRSGCDVYMSIPSLGIERAIVDEKAASHYINKDLRTYSLELSQITRGGKEVDGWFLDKKNKTQYYMLIYLKGNVSSWKDITEDNITEVEYYLVSKESIKNYLFSKGYGEEELRDLVAEIREDDDFQRKNTPHGFSFVISRKFIECPINVVISREVYDKIATFHRIVTPNK